MLNILPLTQPTAPNHQSSKHWRQQTTSV